MLFLPLLLLLVSVSGCLSASLGEDTSPTINKEEISEPTTHKIKELLDNAHDTPVVTTLQGTDLNKPASVSLVSSTVAVNPHHDDNSDVVDSKILATLGAEPSNQQVTAIEHLVAKNGGTAALPATTPTAINTQDLVTSAGSIMTTPESQAITKIIKAVAAQGYETLANSTMATVMKPMPTLGYVVSANSSMATVMKPMPTLGYGVSANSSIATVLKPMPTLSYGVSANGSMTTVVKQTSPQGFGTSMNSNMTTPTTKGTTSSMKTTSGNNVAATTTVAPKKNGSPSTSVSIFLSVVPVVLSLVFNH